ncbi:MAG TPA: ABC transporter ATP-binding protein [Actinomycetota bacterium]|jgi:putative ABC transport system ATP-binding protein|nr:ABC transporter ATP-binding protein [Actinomycetota bacterium]
MGELIRTTDVRRQFQLGDTVVRAVDGIDLTVAEGEFVSIMGPSGCGKSTLLYLLGGLDQPTGGEIHLGGRRVDRLSRTRWARLRRRQIGFVFQSFNLVDNLTVAQNVQLQGMLGGRPGGRAASRRRATALLEELGVADKAKALPAVLSGGQRQRVAIARALMNEPPLLLADEPTGNLDSATTTDVLGLLRRFHAGGQTVVVVTHDPRVATTAAQRLLSMRDGRVVDDVRLDGGTGAARALQDLIEL